MRLPRRWQPRPCTSGPAWYCMVPRGLKLAVSVRALRRHHPGRVVVCDPRRSIPFSPPCRPSNSAAVPSLRLASDQATGVRGLVTRAGRSQGGVFGTADSGFFEQPPPFIPERATLVDPDTDEGFWWALAGTCSRYVALPQTCCAWYPPSARTHTLHTPPARSLCNTISSTSI